MLKINSVSVYDIFTRGSVILKINIFLLIEERLMLNISQEVQFYIVLCYVLISIFVYKILWIRFINVQLQWKQKTAIEIHPSLAIRVISLVKYHLSTIMISNLLEQSLQWILKIKLAVKLLFHMQVSNMLSLCFFMHWVFFWKYYHCQKILVCL